MIELVLEKKPYKSTTHEERFFHIPVGEYSQRFSHVTVFLRKDNDRWHFATAVCVKGDPFCRKTGRQIARRKYFLESPGLYLEDAVEYDQVESLAKSRVVELEEQQ